MSRTKKKVAETPMSGLGRESEPTTRHAAPPILGGKPMLIATEMEATGVSVSKKPPQKRNQCNIILMRGSVPYRDAVRKMAKHYRMSLATLMDVALVAYAKNNGYPHEIPDRATTIEAE